MEKFNDGFMMKLKHFDALEYELNWVMSNLGLTELQIGKYSIKYKGDETEEEEE